MTDWNREVGSVRGSGHGMGTGGTERDRANDSGRHRIAISSTDRSHCTAVPAKSLHTSQSLPYHLTRWHRNCMQGNGWEATSSKTGVSRPL